MKIASVTKGFKKFLGITLAVATVFTSLAQPIETKAATNSRVGATPKLTLSSTRDNSTVYMPTKGSAKVTVKAELTGLQKGDTVLKSEWYVINSHGRYTTAMKNINKKFRYRKVC